MIVFRLLRRTVAYACVLIGGFALGAYVFYGVQTRSFTVAEPCTAHCYSSKNILGLLASVAIRVSPSVLPDVIFETDKTLVIRHPNPEAPIHYVIIPKKDIKDPADITTADEPYLIDAFRVVHTLVDREHLTKYRLLINGSGLQDVAYLHFHLRAEKP